MCFDRFGPNTSHSGYLSEVNTHLVSLCFRLIIDFLITGRLAAMDASTKHGFMGPREVCDPVVLGSV